MKHNLKNRPVFVSEKYGKLVVQKGGAEALRLYSVEMDKWFNGFEHELRESYEFFRKKWSPRSEAKKLQRSTILYQISQILGEEPKE